MAHALTPYFGACYLYAALVADDAFVADALVFAAVAFEVFGGPKDLLTEQAVLLRFQCAVVDRLRFCDFAVRPGADLLRGRCGYA